MEPDGSWEKKSPRTSWWNECLLKDAPEYYAIKGGGQIFKKMFTFAILCFFTDSIQSIISPVRLLGFLAY